MTIVDQMNSGNTRSIFLIDRPSGSALAARLAGSGDFALHDPIETAGSIDLVRAAGTRCDGALMIVAADDRGLSRLERGVAWLRFSGARRVVVAVEAKQADGIDADRLAEIGGALGAALADDGIEIAAVVPAHEVPWYDGPTPAEALAETPPASGPPDPLRMTITSPARSATSLSGLVQSGEVAPGDEILISPSNGIATVTAIAANDADTRGDRATAGMSVELSLDRMLSSAPGDVVSHMTAPPLESSVFRIRLTWFGRDRLMAPRSLSLRLGASETVLPVTIERVERIIDPPAEAENGVPPSALADVIVRAERVVAVDPAVGGMPTGRAVLLDGGAIVGAGGIDMTGYPDQRRLTTSRATNISEVAYRVDGAMRMARNGHVGGVLWFTGLSGAGKSTLAVELERHLFDQGYQAYILDGDNLRHGLNTNLGFSPDDRAENIRRVGEVAALFAEAGFIVVSAFISPYRSDRERARAAAPGEFHEIFVKADLATCERRDTKGLYKKARAGEISDFTGISAPYEAPEACELVIDTDRLSISESIDRIASYVERVFPLNSG